MSKLPESGVQLVVKDGKKAQTEFDAFKQALNQVNQAIDQTSKAASEKLNKALDETTRKTKEVTKEVTKAADAVKKTASPFKLAGDRFGDIGKSALTSIPGIGGFADKLLSAGASAGTMGAGLAAALPAIGAVAIALGTLTLGLKLFIDLGKRGTQINTTLQAFGNSVQSFGDSTQVLKNLREQTRGTVSDVELMRLTIASLQGTSEEFRKVVAPNLGKVFDVTARAAKATGASADVVREKFPLGLRRQSKLLLDDIGVMVNAEEAQKRYAESIGKTAGELNDLEKQAAFAQEAIRQLDSIGQEAGINRTEESMARLSASFQNLADKVSVALTPVFDAFINQIDRMVQGANYLLSFTLPVFNTLMEAVGGLIEPLNSMGTAGNGALTPLLRLGSEALPYIAAAAQMAIEGISSVVRVISGVVRTIITGINNTVRSFFPKVNEGVNINLNELAFNLGRGGANIIGSFAAGIARGGAFVLQAVTRVAQIVADFLMGFSPPKMGPLATIDQGGMNVAIAWAEGFVDGIQKPINEVAAEVNAKLGDIASFSREQVAARFAQLDEAMRPFNESLSLAKADMEAIAGFVDPALRQMERQRKAVLDAFSLGTGQGDVNALRQFDAQIDRLKEIKDLGQDQVDQAEIQAGLAKAYQAQERAALSIQQARLGEAEKIQAANEETAKAIKEATEAAGKEAKAAGGSGAATGGGEATTGGFTPGEAPDLFANDAIANARAQIQGVINSGMAGVQAGLSESGATAAIAGLRSQAGELQTQIGRIAKADPVGRLQKKFEGLADKLLNPFNTVKEEMDKVFESLFGEEGSVSGFLTRFSDRYGGIFTNEDSIVQRSIDKVGELATSFSDTLTNALDSVGFDSLTEKLGLSFINDDSTLKQAQTSASETLDGIDTKFTDITGSINTSIDNVLGDNGTIPTAIRAFGDTTITIFDDLFKPGGRMEQWMTAFETTVSGVITNVIGSFSLLVNEGPGTLKEALSTFGEVLSVAIVSPARTAFNDAIQATEDAINGVILSLREADFPIGDAIRAAGLDIIHLQKLPGAAVGALGIKGSFIAGERGPELITTKRPANVFPARATAALASIESVLARPQPVFVRGGGNTSNSTSNTNFNNNFNLNSAGQAALIQRQQRAMAR